MRRLTLLLIMYVVLISATLTGPMACNDDPEPTDGDADSDVDGDSDSDTDADSDGDLPPVYVYIFDHTEDHINVGEGATLGHCEARWYRLYELLERLSEEYPDATLDGSPWVNLQFHGAEADSLEDRNELTAAAPGADGIGLADRTRGAIDDGLIDIGYHAAHEPTYESNAFTDVSCRSLSVEEQFDLSEEYLACWRDPIRGAGGPNYCDAGDAGGILEVNRVLLGFDEGEPGNTVVTGLRCAAGMAIGSVVLDRFAPNRMGFGFDDHVGGSGGAERLPQEHFDSAGLILEELATMDGAVYGLHFVHGTLVTSMYGDTERGFGGFGPRDGPAELERRIGLLPEGIASIAKFHLGAKYIYTAQGPDCSSPTQWGYSNPDTPMLEDDCIRDEDSQEEYWTFLEEELRYLIEQVFTDRPGSAIVTPSALIQRVEPGHGFEVTAEQLYEAAEAASAPSEGFPLFVMAGERPLALADLFRLLAEALGHWNEHESLPESLTVGRLRPGITFDPHDGAVTSLAGEAVLRTAVELAERYDAEPTTRRALLTPPRRIDLVDREFAATSGFLQAMCRVYTALQDDGTLPAEVDTSPRGIEHQETYVDAVEPAALWGYKPALWR